MAMTFTLEVALQYQDENLSQWQEVLRPEIYAKVERIVKRKNNGITNPYAICRGSDIDNIVKNISMGNEKMYDVLLTVKVSVEIEIKTSKTFDQIQSSLKRGIYRGLDSGPEHVAQPKDVEIKNISLI